MEGLRNETKREGRCWKKVKRGLIQSTQQARRKDSSFLEV